MFVVTEGIVSKKMDMLPSLPKTLFLERREKDLLKHYFLRMSNISAVNQKELLIDNGWILPPPSLIRGFANVRRFSLLIMQLLDNYCPRNLSAYI